MAPETLDLTITRGDTETVVVTLSDESEAPINITGRTYTAQMRSTPSIATIAAEFTCTVTNGSNGELTCILSSADSELLSPGQYYWDLQEDASGVISTLLSGIVNVLADVTR